MLKLSPEPGPPSTAKGKAKKAPSSVVMEWGLEDLENASDREKFLAWRVTAPHLQQNEIVDVTPLASLTAITELSLYENEIVDMSPLGDLVSLPGFEFVKGRGGVEQLVQGTP